MICDQPQYRQATGPAGPVVIIGGTAAGPAADHMATDHDPEQLCMAVPPGSTQGPIRRIHWAPRVPVYQLDTSQKDDRMPASPAPGDPAMLRERIRELEHTIELYQMVLDALPLRVFWKDRDSRYLGCNRLFASDAGQHTPADVVGQTDDDPRFPWTAQAELYQSMDRSVIESDTATINFEEPQHQVDGSTSWLRTSKIPLHDSDGAVFGVLGTYEDITAIKRAEQARLQAQEQTIEVQQSILREMSTPLIPISDEIVVLPLIGTIDSQRAQQVLNTLLQGISETHCRIAILDITGVATIDTQVANALLQAARGVRLLGAEVIVSGIRPEVAQTLVGLGIELEGIVPAATLQSGIAYAVGYLERAGRGPALAVQR